MASNRPYDFDDERSPSSPRFSPKHFGLLRPLLALVLICAIVYGGYFWFVRRIVVGPDEVLVLLRKDAGKSLPGDQVIIPRPPKSDSPDFAAWDEKYGDCNGIVEQVYQAGTYFGFSPWDYERDVIKL